MLESDIRVLLQDISHFSRAGSRPLRFYQTECARAIIRSVVRRQGQIFTVMFARQMGKNELSAQLEAYLMALHAGEGGSIVKAAPSFKPQVINSILRLKDTLESSPLTRQRWTPHFGYMLGMGRCRTVFLSADRKANVVGATASLLLEIDEAQDVDPEKYDREFRPMAASANATTVLYGTAWGQDSVLEEQRRRNLEHEGRGGERLHFEYDWRALASVNPAYEQFVLAERDRLGEMHPTFQTQYLLRCLSDAGRLFAHHQLGALRGSHYRQTGPEPDRVYVAGIDLAGEDEQGPDASARSRDPRRDSTVVTIAEVRRDGAGQPVARVVEHVWWTGRSQVWQFENLLDLWRRWGFARVCVDASGIGAGVAAFLHDRYPERTERLIFTAPAKSSLAYGMLGMANTGRLSVYADDGSPQWRRFWSETEACRYSLRAGEQMAWGVPDSQGHDDFVVSLALACRAAEALAMPAVGRLLRPAIEPEPRW